MKKYVWLCCFVAFLSGCANDGIHDSYSAYRNQTASQLYQSATKDLKKEHYDSAAKTLEALNALFPFGAHAEEGQINLMYAYYQNDATEAALVTADRYLQLYPRGQYADYVYYMKGVIGFDQGLSWFQKKVHIDPSSRDPSHFTQSFLAFDDLIRFFPHSVYAPDAVIRMRYIRNMIAQNELETADFYFQRKAYVAAINRATVVIEHFDRTPSVIPALALLVKSYRLLGLTTMADRTMVVFKLNYPDSTAYRQLLRSH